VLCLKDGNRLNEFHNIKITGEISVNLIESSIWFRPRRTGLEMRKSGEFIISRALVKIFLGAHTPNVNKMYIYLLVNLPPSKITFDSNTWRNWQFWYSRSKEDPSEDIVWICIHRTLTQWGEVPHYVSMSHAEMLRIWRAVVILPRYIRGEITTTVNSLVTKS